MQDWLAARAIASPEQVAITAADITLSYQELNELVAQHSLILAQHRQKRIALFARSRYLTIVIAFTLMRIGKTIVPINTRLTKAEVRYQIRNTRTNLATYAATWDDMEMIPSGGFSTHGIFDEATEDMPRE